MPGLNGTGPLGYGARTGRGLGFCTGYLPAPYSPNQYNQPSAPIQQPYYSNYPTGIGWGRGLGLGYGRGLGLGLGYGRGLGLGLGYGRGLGLGIGWGARRRFW